MHRRQDATCYDEPNDVNSLKTQILVFVVRALCPDGCVSSLDWCTRAYCLMRHHMDWYIRKAPRRVPAESDQCECHGYHEGATLWWRSRDSCSGPCLLTHQPQHRAIAAGASALFLLHRMRRCHACRRQAFPRSIHVALEARVSSPSKTKTNTLIRKPRVTLSCESLFGLDCLQMMLFR